jgi:hypothetical protein
MNVTDVLTKLDLGSSVAEFDQMIERHFVITNAFRELVAGKVDIVAGDKGAGKTTIYNYLQNQHANLPQLGNVEIVPAFNPSGNPVFRRLITRDPYSEVQYIAFWKIYILSLVGNRLLKRMRGAPNSGTQKLDVLLAGIGLRSKDDSVVTIFTRLSKWFHRLMNPVAVAQSETGLPAPSSELNTEGLINREEANKDEIIDYDESLALLNTALEENDITVWVLLDRLDEAFTGYPDTEQPALRALFRTYLDMRAFQRIGLKLFVRRDLFKRIIRGGFVNLSHVSARKAEIIWDQEDLFSLLCRRIKTSDEFLGILELNEATNEQVFSTVFPDRIARKLTTWNWMLSSIQDGTGFAAPRNLVDLVNLAIEEQTRREWRESRTYAVGVPLIELGSLERALIRLSQRRLEDTLLAEATEDVAVLIEGFRGAKPEHNDASIANIFGVSLIQAKEFAEVLINIGFFSRGAEKHSIPLLYRSALDIKADKVKRAFSRS